MFEQKLESVLKTLLVNSASNIDHDKVQANKSVNIVDDNLISYALLSDIVLVLRKFVIDINHFEPFQESKSVSVTDHLDGDPHLMTFLNWIPDQLQNQHLDYTNALTTTEDLNPEFLVCLNPGDGRSLLGRSVDLILLG